MGGGVGQGRYRYRGYQHVSVRRVVKGGCLAAATIAPELRFQHWDVALTGDGPVLLELNVQGSLDLVQLAAQKGIYEFLGS